MLTHKHRIRGNTITGLSVAGRRIKVTVARNIAGDYYAVSAQYGWFGRRLSHQGGDIVVRELVREYVVAKRQGRR